MLLPDRALSNEALMLREARKIYRSTYRNNIKRVSELFNNADEMSQASLRQFLYLDAGEATK